MEEDNPSPNLIRDGNSIRINLNEFMNNPNLQPRLVERISNADRRFHHRINATHEILDERISKKYFSKTINELREKSSVYIDIWEIRKIKFPNIIINIKSSSGNELLIISLNYRNYNFLPPQIGFFTPEMNLIHKMDNKLIIPDENEIRHLIPHNNGLWACIPGTFEYHDFYYDLDRWELVRGSEDDNIIVLLQRIVNMIDRNNPSL